MNKFEYWQERVIQRFGLEKNIKPGLSRVKSVCDHLVNHRKLSSYIITVAGTNGKGETIAHLARVLSENNITYSLWTSPHENCLSERFQTNNKKIDESKFEHYCSEIWELADTRGIALSFYEFFFCVYVRFSLELMPEVLLLEVGLGGRLDAVNYFDANLVLIPSISRDHQEYLGNRLDLILREKWGVVRDNAQVFTAFESRYLIEIAKSLKSGNYKNLDIDSTQFSVRNWDLAREALLYLAGKLNRPISIRAASQSILPSRGELIEFNGLSFEFYGAHNLDGLRKLVQFLCQAHYNNHNLGILLSFSQRDAKDLVSMVKLLDNFAAKAKLKVYLTQFEHDKAHRQMKRLSHGYGNIIYLENYKENFWPLSTELKTEHWILAGSYYFISEFKHSFFS